MRPLPIRFPAFSLPALPRAERGPAAALAVLTLAGLAACTSSGGSGSVAGQPVYGGTLRVISNAGPGSLDPVPTYNYAGYELERGYARQLLTFPTTSPTTTSGPSWVKATTLVPDLATQVPRTANGGITDHGLVYTYRLRSGVDWNSHPARQVTAGDFIREFKAFCNPGQFPVGNSTYFTSTIAGLASYCQAESKHFTGKGAPAVTAAAVAAWQDSHTVAGLTAKGPLTLQVRLIQPASDFNDIMALPFVSARPAEYDHYLPGSNQLNQHMMSDGPYQVSQFVPNKQIVLTRNPVWRQATDPVRHQYVAKVVVTMGTSSEQTVLTDIQASSQDLFLADLGIPTASIAGLRASADKRLTIWPSSNLNPYVILNLRSPNAGGAMGKLAVRQAIEYGVNKSAVVKVEGGPALNTLATGAVPPGNVGYQPQNPYPTPGSQGSPSKCKALLSQAGYPHGLTLNYLYANDSGGTTLFQSLQGSLALCGITLKGIPKPSGGAYFTDLGDTPQTNKPGTWDMATGSWYPDWFGNNGRTTIQPLFGTNCTLGTVNAGCYSSPTVDSLIQRALQATSAAAATALWQQAASAVMKDAPIVPLVSSKFADYTSTRVHSATDIGAAGGGDFSTLLQGWDFTNMWLDPNKP
jgi:peptide/nickel transport system substrate-binding protein